MSFFGKYPPERYVFLRIVRNTFFEKTFAKHPNKTICKCPYSEEYIFLEIFEKTDFISSVVK